MKYGFTGTRFGMTDAQKDIISGLMSDYRGNGEFHHGDCVGADADAHDIAFGHKLDIVIHPPVDNLHRAFCEGAVRLLETASHLKRNRTIVDACRVLLATPHDDKETYRSGTWYTIRYGLKQGKEVVVVLPNGMVTMDPATIEAMLLPGEWGA